MDNILCQPWIYHNRRDSFLAYVVHNKCSFYLVYVCPCPNGDCWCTSEVTDMCTCVLTTMTQALSWHFNIMYLISGSQQIK